MPSVGGLPSVSEILQATGLMQSYRGLAPEHAQRGQALHEAIRLDAEGVLDPTSLHPEILNGYAAYRRFLAETDHVPVASEVEVVDTARGFCGHIDRIGHHGGDSHRALYDWKFSNQPDLKGARYQLAGYALLDGDADVACYVVNLRKDGTYRLHDVTDAESREVFLAALKVYRAREGR